MDPRLQALIDDYPEQAWVATPTGLRVKELPNHVYHAMPGISSTQARKILPPRTPHHYYTSPPMEATDALIFGTAFHSAVLEPALYRKDSVEAGWVSTKGAAYKKWAADREPHEIIVLKGDLNLIDVMADSVFLNSAAAELLRGTHEESFFAIDPNTDLMIKCRLDAFPDEEVIVDLKSAREADDEGFTKAATNLGYHIQMAFYSYVVSLVIGRVIRDASFIVTEKTDAPLTTVYDLDHDDFFAGMSCVRKALLTISKCQKANYWPGYNERQQLILKPWRLGDAFGGV